MERATFAIRAREFNRMNGKKEFALGARWRHGSLHSGMALMLMVAAMKGASAELVAEPTPTAADYAGTLTTDLGGESSLVLTPQANQPGANGIQEGTRSEDRVASRSAIQSAEKMQATVQSADEIEAVSLSHSELLRNKRTRLEIQNEDLLQRRLEELRFRDEQRRMDQILAKEGYVKQAQNGETLEVGLSNPVLSAPAPASPVVVMQEQVVSPSLAPVAKASSVPTVQPAAVSSAIQVSSASIDPVPVGEESSARVSLIPRFGVSNFQDQVAPQIVSRFAAGLGLGLDVTDNLAFEIGYTYSEFGVGGWSTNPYVSQLQVYTNTAQPISVKQNVMDAGLKLYALGAASRLRPYLFAGAAYTKSFVNYDQQIVQYLAQQGLTSIARDLESSAFLGALGVGMDVKLTSNIFVGLSARYYSVLNSNVSSNAMGIGSGLGYPGYSGYYYNPAAAAYLDYDKQVLGGGFARSDFYTIAGSIGFSF